MQNCQPAAIQLRTRQLVVIVLSMFMFCVLVGAKAAMSESGDEATSQRKVVTRVEPDYPETLKRLYIGGVVRVEVVVAPGGSVESAQLVGGNPILGQAAMKAVKKWKYTPANAKEKFVVKFDFDPHGN